MFNAQISDFTGSIWVCFTKEHGNALLGMSAHEYDAIKDDQDKVDELVDSLQFKKVNMMIRGRQSSYNGETRLKYFAVKVIPQANIISENQALLKRLDCYNDVKEGNHI